MRYIWIILIIIFILVIEPIMWINAIDGFKFDYRNFSCTDDKKIKRIIDTFKYNVGLSILIIIHMLLLFVCSFLYWLFC